MPIFYVNAFMSTEATSGVDFVPFSTIQQYVASFPMRIAPNVDYAGNPALNAIKVNTTYQCSILYKLTDTDFSPFSSTISFPLSPD